MPGNTNNMTAENKPSVKVNINTAEIVRTIIRKMRSTESKGLSNVIRNAFFIIISTLSSLKCEAIGKAQIEEINANTNIQKFITRGNARKMLL
jgi:hypothetical protein